MTPYTLFSYCQIVQHRKSVSVESFEENPHFQFYCSLIYYFSKVLKFASDAKIKKFISVCVQQTGTNFNPFLLSSPEYLHIFTEWYKVHANNGAYYININNSFQKLFKFCSDKKIKSIEEYTKRWAVSHIISGVLNENIAYMLGLQNLKLTSPEVLSIKNKFLKHANLIGERIDRDEKLKSILEYGVNDLSNKLLWLNKKV